MRLGRPDRKPSPPDIEPRDRLCAVEKFILSDASILEHVLITKAVSPALKVSHIELREVVLHEVDFSDATINYGKLSDVIFELSNLANSEWKSLYSSRIVYDRCQMLGIKVNDAELFDLKAIDCQMQYAQMRFSELARSWFERCDLRGADFSGSDLMGASFEQCDLTGAFFSEAKCSGVDFRSSTIDGLTVGPESLVGAIINPVQATDIARVFGLTVLDENEDIL